MKNKKHSKKHEESSSSSDSDNEADSSSSSSQSRESSPAPKKSKRELKEENKGDKGRKYRTSDDERDLRNIRKQLSDNESSSRAKHNTVEQSRWDSPSEKLERRDKKSERYRRSNSKERENSKSKSRIEKKQELEEKYHRDHKYDQSRDYSSNKNEERYRHDRRMRKYDDREYQNERYDKKDRRNDRDEYYKDKNRRDRSGKMDEHHFTKRYGHDRSNADQSRNRSDSYPSRYRNRSHRSRSRSLDPTDIKWGKEGNDDKSKSEKLKEKEKPNFGLSGKLTEETNTYRGIVIKYSEPPEARKPKRRWRLYPFKGEKALQTLYIHRESAYLIGRERKIVDLPVDHPSCSKQHAVLQYRLVPFTREDGSQGKKVRPYLIDLDSANGTFINNKKIDPRKYIELLEKDVIKFGYSSREYVLLHENSKDEAQDDDVKEEEVFEQVKKEKE